MMMVQSSCVATVCVAFWLCHTVCMLAHVCAKHSCGLLSSTSSFRPDSTQPAQDYPGKCSAMAFTQPAPKGCLVSATARLGTSAKPFCSFSDCFEFKNKHGNVDAMNQVALPTSSSRHKHGPKALTLSLSQLSLPLHVA